MENNEHIKQVIEGCLKNKRRSQEELFRLYYGKMLSVCMRYTNDKDSAEDVVQEGFIKVFENLERFNYKSSLGAWIRRIMVNTAIDKIRKNKKNPILSKKDEDFKLAGENKIEIDEEKLYQEMKVQEALKAIQQLSPKYRMVFNLYVIEDYSHKEIAEMLGISEGTSKSNLSKAKNNLKKILTKNKKRNE